MTENLTPQNRPERTIRSIEAIPLNLPYEIFGPKPLLGGHPRQMEMLLVRVETSDGIVGWGEAFGYPYGRPRAPRLNE
jgi:L-alanine-DL-glutamate epimerase-like enolase superfamily enzyme